MTVPIRRTNDLRYHSKDNLWLRVAENEKTTQPIEYISSRIQRTQNDSLIASDKAGLWLKQLQDSMGKRRFDDKCGVIFPVAIQASVSGRF